MLPHFVLYQSNRIAKTMLIFRSIFWYTCLFPVAGSFHAAGADEGSTLSPRANQARGDDGIEWIKIENLPQPPETIAKLLEDGQVSFQAGPRSEGNEFISTNGRADVSRRLAAETRFRFQYDFRSNNRWQVSRREGKRVLVIRANYASVTLQRSHLVWFRRRPDRSEFWTSRLVRHELDHVSISTDPTLKARFEELVRDQTVIRETIDRETKVDEDLVQEIVKRRVQQAFEQVVDLARIRYRELDRVTDHGLRSIPQDSSLWRWLR